MVQDRKPLDANAFAVMVLLTAIWGFNQVAIKTVAADVSLLMQAAIRSMLAAALLFAWARARAIPLFERDGTWWPGIAAGLLFGGEFIFIYGGLAHTNASRMIVFVYLAPALTALGMHFVARVERLGRVQWLGIVLAFCGLASAFADGFTGGRSSTLVGDLCGVMGALFWSSTTVLIRATSLARATATKTSFYQLVVSMPVLFAASYAMGEEGVVALTPLAVASLAYQGAIVAFATYLAWFWLLKRYLAAPLSVLSFLTPMFGVLSGVLFLDEPLTGYFALAALLVAGGIVLVNLRR